MSIGASFGNALRSHGKRAASGTINRSAKGYGKANKKIGTTAKKHFKAFVTKPERKASADRKAKRAKQSRQLKRIK